VLPLSKAVFAVIVLYYAVAHWNSYFTGMMYLNDLNLKPLQVILRDILNTARVDLSQIEDAELLAALRGSADLMKYSMVVVSSAPILIAYQFVRSFFEKGVMLGSVKG
jgi:ABC-type glycerol-3-phosphate transport system permease component